MTRYIQKMLLLSILLMTAWLGPVQGEEALNTVKENVKAALLNSNYHGEYTITSFRFGRRQEVTYRLWVKDNYRAQQVQSPSWQRGELLIETDKNYIYFIPSQNSGLKLERTATKEQVRIGRWQFWLNKLTRVQNGPMILGRETLALEGEQTGGRFKLFVAKETYLPVAFEFYRGNLLSISSKFSQLDNFNQGFNPNNLLPERVKWYNDKSQYWKMVSVPRIQTAVSFPILQPNYLPEGFVFKRASVEELSSATVALLVFEAPGHKRISLFEREKLSDKQHFDLETLKGSLNKSGPALQGYQWFEKQVHLTLLGNVSVEELKKIAASVR